MIKVTFMALLLCFQTLGSFSPHLNKSNSWQIGADEDYDSQIDKKSFEDLISRIYALYINQAPNQASQLKRKMIIKTMDWNSPYFSAWASYDSANDVYEINFWGGMARLTGMTKLGYALTICHEIGHILGGKPYHNNGHQDYMTSEGQSDYFASAECIKKYASIYKLEPVVDFDPYATSLCFEKFEQEPRQFRLCLQSAKAGKDLSQILADLARKKQYPAFDTPSPQVVETTLYNSYPSVQCRLDTYLAGALTTYNNSNLTQSNKEDLRPSCWFRHDEQNNAVYLDKVR